MFLLRTSKPPATANPRVINPKVVGSGTETESVSDNPAESCAGSVYSMSLSDVVSVVSLGGTLSAWPVEPMNKAATNAKAAKSFGSDNITEEGNTHRRETMM